MLTATAFAGSAFQFYTVYKWYKGEGGRNPSAEDVARGVRAGAATVYDDAERQPLVR